VVEKKKIFIDKISNDRDMRKKIATIRALLRGEASIEYVDKTLITRTPGDVTVVSHN